MARPKFQAPKGTRDLYPEEMLRRRYITGVWRDTAIRCGFEEIEGPAFESSELYAVKSGDGILGELFQAFSGKSPEEVERVMATGRGPFALRPEFTPTLARMYAARAAQLGRPTKWFMVGSFFRAERPQRGRLREFLQWNCDVIGSGGLVGEEAEADLDCAETSAAALHAFGLTPDRVKTRLSNRRFIAEVITKRCGVPEANLDAAFALLDKRAKLPPEILKEAARAMGFDIPAFDALTKSLPFIGTSAAQRVDQRRVRLARDADGASEVDIAAYSGPNILGALSLAIGEIDAADRYLFDFSIVRGLAYYTGTVFELIADGERAIAGGGRYDNLIEMLGGPATPAVGFAMGDVVLGLLLEENGLMPEGKDLRDAVSRTPASLRPEAIVLTPDETKDADVRRVVSRLRRGVESEAWLARDDRKPWDRDRYACPPIHARRTTKSSRNVGKLLADAATQHAVLAVILEPDGSATIKNLDRGEETKVVEINDLVPRVRDALLTSNQRGK